MYAYLPWFYQLSQFTVPPARHQGAGAGRGAAPAASFVIQENDGRRRRAQAQASSSPGEPHRIVVGAAQCIIQRFRQHHTSQLCFDVRRYHRVSNAVEVDHFVIACYYDGHLVADDDFMAQALSSVDDKPEGERAIRLNAVTNRHEAQVFGEAGVR